MKTLRQLDSKLTVAGQLRPADVEDVVEKGFRLLINNRPDGEAFFGQASMASIEDASQACGLETRYLPVTLASIGPSDVRRFHDLLEAAPGPVLAYCKTGLRCALLWVLAEAGFAGRDIGALMNRARTEGFDLSSQQALIDRVLAEGRLERLS